MIRLSKISGRQRLLVNFERVPFNPFYSK